MGGPTRPRLIHAFARVIATPAGYIGSNITCVLVSWNASQIGCSKGCSVRCQEVRRIRCQEVRRIRCTVRGSKACCEGIRCTIEV